jgi:hypothetical protein
VQECKNGRSANAIRPEQFGRRAPVALGPVGAIHIRQELGTTDRLVFKYKWCHVSGHKNDRPIPRPDCPSRHAGTRHLPFIPQ